VITAMTHQARRNAAMYASAEPGDPTMATKMATPTAKPIWRTMLITPDPVANDDAGSAEVPTPISVGNVSPTPMPDRITQRARRETNESSASEERRNRIANALGATRARKAILGG